MFPLLVLKVAWRLLATALGSDPIDAGGTTPMATALDSDRRDERPGRVTTRGRHGGGEQQYVDWSSIASD